MPSMHDPYGYSRALNQHPPYASMSMYNGSQAAPNQLAFGFQPPLGAMAPPSHGAGHSSMSGFNSMPNFGGIPSFNSIPSFNPMPSAPPSQAYGFQPYGPTPPRRCRSGRSEDHPMQGFCKRPLQKGNWMCIWALHGTSCATTSPSSESKEVSQQASKAKQNLTVGGGTATVLVYV